MRWKDAVLSSGRARGYANAAAKSGIQWWAAATLLLVWAGSVLPASADNIEDQARGIARELQCPVCENLSVADSPSQLATQMRGVIREQLEAGERRDDILRYFADRYGEGILLSPPRSGFTLVVWIAPYLGLTGAIAFLVWAVRRRPAAPASEITDSPGLGPYLEQVDAAVEQLRDEPVR